MELNTIKRVLTMADIGEGLPPEGPEDSEEEVLSQDIAPAAVQALPTEIDPSQIPPEATLSQLVDYLTGRFGGLMV